MKKPEIKNTKKNLKAPKGVLPDKTAPSIKNVAPKPGDATSGAMPGFNGSFADTDDSEFTEIEKKPNLVAPHKWPKDANGDNMPLVGILKQFYATREFYRESNGTGEGGTVMGTGAIIVTGEDAQGKETRVAVPLTANLRFALKATGNGVPTKSPYMGRVIKITLGNERIPNVSANKSWDFGVAVKGGL